MARIITETHPVGITTRVEFSPDPVNSSSTGQVLVTVRSTRSAPQDVQIFCIPSRGYLRLDGGNGTRSKPLRLVPNNDQDIETWQVEVARKNGIPEVVTVTMVATRLGNLPVNFHLGASRDLLQDAALVGEPEQGSVQVEVQIV